ncbi:GNAT family N-acetyltransferase [Microbacterium sediminicola]|uniref:GNAT family N-acetyltransferase n=1 Tax=Microbacterium sediminicola TaxID=415210 RepID=A0ABN2HJ46_9MICO
MDVIVLRTERLELSPPTEADIDALYEACQDDAIQRYTTVPSPYTRADAENFVALIPEWWADGSEANWAIRLGGKLVGMIGLHKISLGAAKFGYWIAPEARGIGVSTEAGRAVIDAGFQHFDLQRIEWRAVVGNVASAGVARSLGFRYEGILRLALYSPRGREDAWVSGILTTDDRTPQPWPPLGD